MYGVHTPVAVVAGVRRRTRTTRVAAHRINAVRSVTTRTCTASVLV